MASILDWASGVGFYEMVSRDESWMDGHSASEYRQRFMIRALRGMFAVK